MARIFKTQAILGSNTDDVRMMDNMVLAYWGSEEGEKAFTIPYWKAKQLVAASTIEEIALKVTDIFIPTLVDAEWVVFEEGDEETLGGRFRPNDYYFVITEALVENIRSTFANTPIQNLSIGGRLGKDVKDDGTIVYRAFIYGFECKVIPPGGGTGGGTAGGAKIPSNGDE